MANGQPPVRIDWAAEPSGRHLILDVFTDTPLEGNQLGVFTDARAFSAERMQRLALELGFSETVFFLPAEGAGDVRVRIFTPEHELPFAGHPVLGSAFVAGEALELERVEIETGAGVIPVELEREEDRVAFGRMRQPIPSWYPYERAGELLAGVGVERSGLPVEAYPNGPLHVFVELGSAEEVAALDPDFGALAKLGNVCANCFAAAGEIWKTRMFAPAAGVPEDPATGSAAGPLAVHLARYGRIAFGDQIEIRQGVEINRPSTLYARADGEGDRIDRVEVAGSAVIVAGGEFGFPERQER